MIIEINENCEYDYYKIYFVKGAHKCVDVIDSIICKDKDTANMICKILHNITKEDVDDVENRFNLDLLMIQLLRDRLKLTHGIDDLNKVRSNNELLLNIIKLMERGKCNIFADYYADNLEPMIKASIDKILIQIDNDWCRNQFDMLFEIHKKLLGIWYFKEFKEIEKCIVSRKIKCEWRNV